MNPLQSTAYHVGFEAGQREARQSAPFRTDCKLTRESCLRIIAEAQPTLGAWGRHRVFKRQQTSIEKHWLGGYCLARLEAVRDANPAPARSTRLRVVGW